MEFLKQADSLQGFKALRKAWLKDNKETWLSKEIGKSIDKVNRAIDNMASYISMEHEDVEIQIELEPDYAKGKMLSTVIKRTDEWKSLKKYLEKNHNFKNQNITVKALIHIVLEYAREFSQKI